MNLKEETHIKVGVMMALNKVLDYAKRIIKEVTCENDYLIDATVGNGHDTLFLAQLVPYGKVFGFDIQTEAINHTKKLLEDAEQTNVELFNISHEAVDQVIPKELHGKIAGVMFNLGYLPGGNKAITTKTETTIKTLEKMLKILKTGGVISIVVYPGHEEGKKESKALLEYLKELNQRAYQCLIYRFINHKEDAPYVLAIEKRY